MRKLVELNPDTMMTKEIDLIKLERCAQALRQYLLDLKPEDDQHRIRELVLPIADQALARTLNLPYDFRNKPLFYESVEGLLPAEYNKLAAPFFVTASGMGGLGTELMQPIIKDGKPFVWMEFEEVQ